MKNGTNQPAADQRKADETKIYLTPDSTLQSADEARRDKSDTSRPERLEVSNDDLHETDADRMAGSDRAGTAERKDNEIDSEE